MARRVLATTLPARPASLGLALPILCTLILAGSLPPAAARHVTRKAAAETAQPATAVPEPAAASAPGVAPEVPHRSRHGQGRAGAGQRLAGGGVAGEKRLGHLAALADLDGHPAMHGAPENTGG